MAEMQQRGLAPVLVSRIGEKLEEIVKNNPMIKIIQIVNPDEDNWILLSVNRRLSMVFWYPRFGGANPCGFSHFLKIIEREGPEVSWAIYSSLSQKGILLKSGIYQIPLSKEGKLFWRDTGFSGITKLYFC